MAIITISRGSYSRGKEIAEKLAQKLGYECISRDIILEASKYFDQPEAKLIRAIHDAPSFLERFKHGREKYIAYVREAFLYHLQKDNIVYHGLAGHFLARGIPNILKVRVIANIEDRVAEEMKRENISENEALHVLRKDDEERRKWSMSLYGIDTKDASLYDVVLHIDNLRVSEGVDVLADIVKYPGFQTTPESKLALKDMHLGAKAYAAIVDKFPAADVTSKDGVVVVRIEALMAQEADLSRQLKELLKDLDDIKEVRVHIIPLDT